MGVNLNFKRWSKRNHSDETFMAKLTEEFGEVGKARSEIFRLDLMKNPCPKRRAKWEKNLREELHHVEFMARCWRLQLEAGN